MIPVAGDRAALEDGGENGRQCKHDQAGGNPFHAKPKPMVGENTEVQEQDRKLGQIQGNLVGNLACKESLS